ncbi:MAG: NAD(P)/FAD-dependent oxidoreductase [Candidatus Manganitrophus sp. SA1]|nr:NAD(P)/FAD-dependent oxidoreductase [Candidatus Manganitrophus morganii]
METNVARSGIIPSQDPADHHTIIIGAGPAGLAVGACLKRAGVPFLILEQSDRVGAAWHRHYSRLHLHTDKAHSTLPFVPFPKEVPRYPSRLQVIQYLEMYARQFQLEPRFDQHVVAARRVNGVWEVQTENTRYQAVNLVVAAGYNREPYLPHWPGQTSFRGTLLHSSQYRNGAPFKNRKVLVVGFGNSGGEIAIDLWEQGAQPSLAVRSPVNVIPRELFGIPILSLGIALSKLPPRWVDAATAPILRAVMGDLTRYGLRTLPRGPMSQIRRDARIPLIDVGTIDLIKQGRITVRPGIERFTEEGVRFTDGSRRTFDAVILATGYRPRVNAFLEGASATYDENGTPLTSGREAAIPGLYFCGYDVSPTGMLREIALEAQRIGDAISRKRAGAVG